mgnify:FL=1
MSDHNILKMLERGVKVTVNSDDPSYFGGYVAANYLALAESLPLDVQHLKQLASNSIEASFMSEVQKQEHLSSIAQL